MNEQIEKIISDVASRHADRRLHLMKVAVEDGATIKLKGRVLDREHLRALQDALAGANVDASAVQVLRGEKPKTRVVATNLTDLHVEPSFLSELLTQMMNGTELEILEEKEKWCLVRMADGYLGWAYVGYQTDAAAIEPTHIVTAPTSHIFAERNAAGVPISRVLGGTRVRADVAGVTARIELAGSMIPAGFVDASHLRSLASLPFAAAKAREQIVADARQFTGVYYLWGGCSAWGIDCSGLAHLTHRMSGYTIPRDADLQFAAATPVDEPFQSGDLIFFAESGSHRKITHVGISAGGWRMIHSSRSKNGVYEEDVQQNENLRKSFVGARTFVAR